MSSDTEFDIEKFILVEPLIQFWVAFDSLKANTMNDFNLCYDRKFTANSGYPFYIFKKVLMFEL